MKVFCTEMKLDKGIYGGRFGGPIIKASTWAKARQQARSLGVILTGELGSILNAETLEEMPLTTARGLLEYNRIAIDASQNASMFRMKLADIVREIARKCIWLADIIEPVITRRKIVEVRP